MKQRPILFSGPMVRALLAGTKTQTRRVVGPEYKITGPNPPGLFDVHRTSGHGKGWCAAFKPDGHGSGADLCPYGVPGDRLWVRERYQPFFKDGCIYLADAGTPRLNAHSEEAALEAWPGWKNPMFMPRKYSRITLEITDVRVQRLQEITTTDAMAEGWPRVQFVGLPAGKPREGPGPFEWYATLWDEINGKRAPWSANPWIWALTFRRVDSARSAE